MKKNNKNLLIWLFLLAISFVSCDKYDTYADQKEREKQAINRFIEKKGIKVISDKEFSEKGNTTDVSNNEYVLFEGNGVYMQIVSKGVGEPLPNNASSTLLCRFDETNIFTDSLLLSNNVPYFSSIVEKLQVRRNYANFTASFDGSSSLMSRAYGSTAVPSGWLVPLSYINVGRVSSEKESIAKVNLIVPHTEGQSSANRGRYPCFYTITYQRGK